MLRKLSEKEAGERSCRIFTLWENPPVSLDSAVFRIYNAHIVRQTSLGTENRKMPDALDAVQSVNRLVLRFFKGEIS